MPRIARLVVPDYPHHITQRGNYRQVVFKDDGDRRQYLEFMAFYGTKLGLAILSYCLMDNHVHFIVVPKNEHSLADTLRIAHTRYSQYFNKKMNVFGHLWQGRFYSCVLDDRRLIAAARYVERNPVRAKIVKTPSDYSWSSARDHVSASNTCILDTAALFKYVDMEQKKWKDFICEDDKMEDVLSIRKHTMTGRPLGNSAFVQKLEKEFDVRLQALPVGRPKIRQGQRK